MSIIQAVGFFFGHGSGNYISRKLGAQETESAEKMASTGFFFALFIGAALAVLGLLFLTPLSLALGSTPTILPYTERYLGIILLGTPFMTASLVLNNQIRFQGNAAYSSYVELNYPFSVKGVDLNATCGMVPYETPQYNVNGFAVTNFALKATKAINFNDKFSLVFY